MGNGIWVNFHWGIGIWVNWTGNHKETNNRTGNCIWKPRENDMLGNEIWVKFGLGKRDFFQGPL